MEAETLRLSSALTGTTVHVVHEAGCEDVTACSEAPVQPLFLHDQHLYPVELRLSGEYAVTELFGVELQLPFRSVTTTIDYTTPEGMPYEPLDPDVHHRDETVAGPGDPWVLSRFGTKSGAWWLAARPGISIPIGSTEADPFELGDRGLRHQHIQLGTGTFDPVLVLEASADLEPVTLQFFAQGQASLYENAHGYRAPARVYGGAAVGTDLIGKLSGTVGLDAFHEGGDRWDGRVRQDGSLGRTELLATTGLSLGIDRTQLNVGARFPLYRHLVVGDEPPGTLSSPVTLTLAVSYLYDPHPD
jgi:hypothetical protein